MSVDASLPVGFDACVTAGSLDALVAATPATRDRVVDFLRAASICAVVFGHWFIGIIWWSGGVMRTTSAIGVTSWLWLMTWAFQVMPIFFFVGGFSNLVSFDASVRRGDSTWTFVKGRLSRLLRPSLVFFAVWGVIVLGLHLFDVGTPTAPRLWGDVTLLRVFSPPGATLPFGPLWFLGVYLVVVCLAPGLIRLHRRLRWWIPAAMVVGAVLADVWGFIGGFSLARWANVAFVLLLPHQLGFFRADGTFARLSKKVFWAMVIAGLGGLMLLTNPPMWQLAGNARFDWFPGIGYYPKSLLGTDVEKVSNAYPPTVCFMLGGIWSIGAVNLLWDRMSSLLQRPRMWKATIALNANIMTLFLWHMTAYLLAIFVLWPLGLGQQHDSTAQWWAERVLWIAVPAVFLLGIVWIFGRFERPRRTPALR